MLDSEDKKGVFTAYKNSLDMCEDRGKLKRLFRSIKQQRHYN